MSLASAIEAYLILAIGIGLMALALCRAAAAGDRHLEHQDDNVTRLPVRLRVIQGALDQTGDEAPTFDDWPRSAA